MQTPAAIAEVPAVPAIYALCGGRGQQAYIAYVGSAGALKTRLLQHLVRRDSSITTGAAVVSLDPGRVTEVRWWEHPAFADPTALQAAELVAFAVLDPVLRSRGAAQDAAKARAAEAAFRERMGALFRGPAAGRLLLPTLQDALERIAHLEGRVARLEAQVAALTGGQGAGSPDAGA